MDFAYPLDRDKSLAHTPGVMKRTPQTFGQRLTRARIERGMSQQELARLVEVREKDISRWENDHNLPRDHEKIVRLAVALKTTTDYLLGAGRKAGAAVMLGTALPAWPARADMFTDSRVDMASLIGLF